MDKIIIELTQEQIQRALIVLGTASYSEIADIIDAIKQQANEQLDLQKEEKHGATNDDK